MRHVIHTDSDGNLNKVSGQSNNIFDTNLDLMTYPELFWWGFTKAEDRQRLAAVIRCGIRSGLSDPDQMSLEDLVTDADDKLLNLILYSKHHVSHNILPDPSDFNYNLKPRRHNLVLTAKSSSITDKDYITRMIFKNIY